METTPSGFSIRHPVMDDLETVADFLVLVTVAEFGEPDYSLDDLRREWAALDLAADAWVVEAPGGGIVGYTSVTHRGHVRIDADGYVHPEHEGRGVGSLLVRTTEARAHQLAAAAPAGVQVVLNNGINGRNPRARALLEREGYAPARHFWRMEIDLANPPPPPVWPAGVTVRSRTDDADDLIAYAVLEEAFQDHWGYVPRSFETWARQHKRERFDPALWFLAFDGGESVGAAVCGHSMGMGWVDSLGVRSAWRRRGLGQALLRHAFAEFRRRGWDRAGLQVDSTNETGATRLYEAVGMRVAHQYAIYQKEIRPGTAPETEPEAI